MGFGNTARHELPGGRRIYPAPLPRGVEAVARRALTDARQSSKSRTIMNVAAATTPAHKNALAIHVSEKRLTIFSNEPASREARAESQSGRLNAKAWTI